MAEVKDPPTDLPTTNALDALPGLPPPAEVRLAGKILCTLVNPPSNGDEIVLMVKLRITEDCTALHEDDTEVHYRKARLLSAWRPGDPQPPTLVTTDGKVDPEAVWDQAPAEGTFTPDAAT